LHPTVKPVALVADAILDACERGDRVLDPFLGSGTTVIAAQKTGRVAYGIELDPKYVDVSVRRWQRLTGLHATHAESGHSFDQTAQQRHTLPCADAVITPDVVEAARS
jgi:DNA modification methylase